jgi:hypothetical protein
MYYHVKTFAFYLMTLRQSMGDYDTDNLITNSEYEILVWFLYILTMLVGNIVFMNFIIAVVSESYESCMESMTNQIWMTKLEMIDECESMLPESLIEKYKAKWFPNVVVLRRVLGKPGSIGGVEDHWQGFIKQMKKHYDIENDVIKNEFKLVKSDITTLQEKMDQLTLNMESGF